MRRVPAGRNAGTSFLPGSRQSARQGGNRHPRPGQSSRKWFPGPGATGQTGWPDGALAVRCFQLHTAEVIPNGEEGPFLVRRNPDAALLGSNAQEHDKLSEIQNVIIGHGVSSYLSDCCRSACLTCRAAACV